MVAANANLADNLRTLHQLHQEFVFGIGHNKAAKDWNADERNGQGKPLKNKYSRRKKIWRIQQYLVNCGFNIHYANDRIRDVYGTDKITPLITIIQNDQKNQSLPFIDDQRFRRRIIVNQN